MQSPEPTRGFAAAAAAAAVSAAMLLLGGSLPPAMAIPQTSACATESCDGFDFSNRQAGRRWRPS